MAIGGSKLRLVLDLRHVNQFIARTTFRYEDLYILTFRYEDLYTLTFRYEDLYTLAEMFEQNDHFFTFDLKSGYHHIAMHPASIKYFGFQWTFIDGRHAYFQFCPSIWVNFRGLHIYQSLTTTCQKMEDARHQERPLS